MNTPAQSKARERHHVDSADFSAVPFRHVIDLLEKSCSQDPYRPALIVEDGLTISRRDLLERSEKLAGYLARILKPGDRVAVMLDNRVEFMVALFAIMANRAMLVSIAPMAQKHDAGHILQDSKPVVVICGEPQRALLDSLLVDHPTVKEILMVEGEEPNGFARYENAGHRLDFKKAACERDDIITVYYTSGTTGAPKGCMLHHGWFLRVIDLDLRMFRRGWQDRQLCCLPFYYADPAIQLVTSLASRGTMVAMRRFSVSRFWDVVTTYDATEILSIASVPALLLKGQPGPNEKDHRIRQAVHAGLPKELHREMVERYGFHWTDQYGSTEGGVMTRVPLHLCDELVGTGAIGVEPPGVEIRVADDNDQPVPDGTAGEALIRGIDLYKGYLGRPEVTAEANKGGWYHSGDLVRRDERGLLYFVGRKKEIIRRSGENISAAEVEAVLRGHPKIIEVAVIPVADTLRGEEVKVYVQLQKGEDLTPEQIVDYCKQNLSAFKVPRYIEFHPEDFERTPSMRVQKQPLRARPDQTKGAWDRESGSYR
jgi:crotonobetaine/carnitine-CoA ligase